MGMLLSLRLEFEKRNLYNDYMNVLIAYATNSGGTYFAAQTVKKVLEAKKFSVTTAEVEDLSPHDFKKYDLIILGSCSWNYKDLEGQLPKSFEEFVKNTPANSLQNKKCAVFGLGDSEYLYFCGAVGILEKYIQKKRRNADYRFTANRWI